MADKKEALLDLIYIPIALLEEVGVWGNSGGVGGSCCRGDNEL